MQTVDALSRAFLSEAPTTDMEQVMVVTGRSPTEIAIERVDMCQNMVIRPETLKRIQEYPQQVEQSEFIMNRWLESMKKINDDTRDFFPSQPWKAIASDMIELHEKHYLVTVDYFSNFAEVDRLYSTTSREVFVN